MLQHAHELGATAVIGIQYDATEVMQGVTEVLCYGTAIVADRIEGDSTWTAEHFSRPSALRQLRRSWDARRSWVA
jgi:hypothetical protein